MGGVPTLRRGSVALAAFLLLALATAAPAAANPLKSHTVRARTTAPAPRGDRPDLSRNPFNPADATLEAALAEKLRDVWAGRNLRRGTTAMYVVDAHSGEPLFAIHENRTLNPASNVKLVSTATALDVLGPDWRYATQLLGPQPDATGAIHGDLYLLGNADPTLREKHLAELATALAAQGVTRIQGGLVSSRDPLRDAIGNARVKVRIIGAPAGQPPVVELEPPLPFAKVTVTARSTRRGRRPRLNVATRMIDGDGPAKLAITVSGRIRTGRAASYWRRVPDPALFTLHALSHALTEAGIAVAGAARFADLDSYVGEATYAGYLPVELARHESAPVERLVAWINKPSNNFLADRLIMTAGAVRFGGTPTMEKGVRAMQEWLASIGVEPDELVLDTGSGLSYQTQMSPWQIVRVVRAAAGLMTPEAAAMTAVPRIERIGGGIEGSFAVGLDVLDALETPGDTARRVSAFVGSLAVAGVDGTLRHRFRNSPARESVVGKTGTLTRVIALAGLVELDDDDAVAFAIVTNGHRHRRRNVVRSEHEELVEQMLDYLETRRNARASAKAAAAAGESAGQGAAPAPVAAPAP